jgi:hypothetical protein
MNLLTNNDLNAINNAFRDIRDTFLQSSITYQKIGERADVFMEDSENIQITSYILPVLIVPPKTDKINILQKGKEDFTEGYVLVFWEDLVTVGLADTTDYFMEANKDFMLLNDRQVEVIGVNKISDLGTLKNYVKIQYRHKPS